MLESPGSAYLRLPRPEGVELPFGPRVSNFYVPPDADVAPHFRPTTEFAEVEERVDEDEGDNAEESDSVEDSDLARWRAEVDDKLEELHDGQLELLAFQIFMSLRILH